MKIMMKKWLLRPLALSLVLLMTVLAPVSVLAEGETETPATETGKSLEEVLANYQLSLDEDTYAYTGEPIMPEVKLVSSEESDDVAYTLGTANYRNHIGVGVATVSVEVSVEGYEGTVEKTADFKIVPSKATGAALVSATTSSIKVTCDPIDETVMSQSSVSWSYDFMVMVYDSASAAWTELSTVSTETNTATVSGLKKAYAYRVKARYVGKSGDTTYTGAWSDVAASPTAPTAPTVKAVKTGATSMEVTWSDIARASGFEVEYSTSSTFSNSKVVKVEDGDAQSKVLTSLSTNKGYYVRMRSYRTSLGVTSYSVYSDTAYTKPEQASAVKFVKRTTTSLKVSCAEAKTYKCTYQFRAKKYLSSKKTWSTAKTVNSDTAEATISGLDSGREYQVSVRYVKEKDGKTYYGAWSDVKTMVTTPNKVVMKAAEKTSSKSMRVTWNANSFGSGYQIQYSTNSKFTNAKTVTVSGISSTKKTVSLASDSVYYARARAYVKIGSKKVYGSWSAKQSTYYGCTYMSYTTTYASSNRPRTNNLQRACSEINGTIIQPGGVFSFNNVVGPRTAARGYQEAIVYQGGKEVPGMGGGICQVATTLFNCALRANCPILERNQHSMTVHYVPLGYDAAISGNAKTLRFSNNTGVPIKIVATCEGGRLTMKFMTNVYKKPPTVTTKVTVSNRVYTLKRYVNGVCNFTTKSKYSDI